MEVKPGQIVALLGGTGSGKTSLVNLIPRFYDANHGRLIDTGHKVYSIDQNNQVTIGDQAYSVENDAITIDGKVYPVITPGKVYIDDVESSTLE